MKPGDKVLPNLARAILEALGESPSEKEIESFAAMIPRQGAQAVLVKVQPALDALDANLLLLVDQFEELFRFGDLREPANRDEAADFVSIMLGLSEQTETPLYVCMTMRSDYIGDCDTFEELPEAMNHSQYLVPRLTRQQRREAIVGPIRLSGSSITPRLLDRLLNESVDTRDDLPILQHVLMRTWTAWAKNGNGPIDTVHYENICTVKQALSRHADEAMKELSEQEKRIAQRLFQTLTETDAGGRRIRRPAPLNEIVAVSGATPEQVVRVIQKFREDNRNFLILSSENLSDDPLVDISHESLIRQWQTLSKWVDQEVESAKMYRRLAETAELYAQGRASLYRETDLQVVLGWYEQRQPTKIWAKRYHEGFDQAIDFLAKSRRRYGWIKGSKRFGLVFAGVCFVPASVVLWIFLMKLLFFPFWSLSSDSRMLIYTKDPSIEITFETPNVRRAFLDSQEVLVPQDNVIRETLSSLPLKKSIHELQLIGGLFKQQYAIPIEVYYYPNWEIRQFPKARSSSADNHEGVYFVAFAPDGRTVISGNRDTTLKLWDVATGQKLRTFEGHTKPVIGVAFDPNGHTVISGSLDKTLKLWEVETGKEMRSFHGHTGGVFSVAFAPDGKTVLSGSKDTTLKLWNVATGEELQTFRGHTKGVNGVAFAPDGKTVLSGSEDTTLKLWNVTTGETTRTFQGHTEVVVGVAFAPDGQTVLSGSGDTTLKLWDVETGEEARTFQGHTKGVNGVAYNPADQIVISGSQDTTLKL